MSALPKHTPTPAEYLEQERAADYKSEYIAGEIFAMSGAKLNHNRISGNLNGEIREQFKGRPCDVLGSDMKVWIDDAESFVYPDLSGLCGDFDFYDEREDVYTNPRFVIEILSASTESYDRGKKFLYYQTLASLQEYVLVSQDKMIVETFRKNGSDWIYHVYKNEDDSLRLESVDCEVRLSEIYRNVKFGDNE